MSKKVLVGMSGGVDSSVASILLKNEGYEVAGVTLKLHDESLFHNKGNQKCGSEKDVEDAVRVCETLGIPHFVCSFKEDFKQKVMDRFVDLYKKGLTPNPCIDCNQFVKFPKLLEIADKEGYDFIATGHYAKKVLVKETNRVTLSYPKDDSKDQTYVLYGLHQEVLSRLLLPLSGFTKKKAREIAEEYGLINSQKKDSQDICFVPDKDYASFIEKYTGEKSKSGYYVNLSGEKIGQHSGIINYTIGQRKGLGVSFGKPQFVISKNALENTVTLADEEYLFKNIVRVSDVNYLSIEKLEKEMKCQVKIRYRQKAENAVIYPNADGTVTVVFENDQRAITPGQAAVFYDGDLLIGGGTISY